MATSVWIYVVGTKEESPCRSPTTIVADAGYGSEENRAFEEEAAQGFRDVQHVPAARGEGIPYVDPESVWDRNQENHGFRRFMLRGLPEAEAERGLVALTHIMIKNIAAKA